MRPRSNPVQELALCESVLELIEEQARVQRDTRVNTVWLEVGSLAAVEIEALRVGFDVVTRGSLAEGAALEIREIPGRARCLCCGESHEIAARGEACPRCGSYRSQLIDGAQIRVQELEVS